MKLAYTITPKPPTQTPCNDNLQLKSRVSTYKNFNDASCRQLRRIENCDSASSTAPLETVTLILQTRDLQFLSTANDNIIIFSYGGKSYTSGRMHSNFAWKYGRVDVRAKLPVGYGLWPAIWMMPRYDALCVSLSLSRCSFTLRF